MKPFLLLATRPEDDVADAEYAAFVRFSGLADSELRRVRLEAAPLPDLDLDDWSGIVVGGSPFTSSDPDQDKSPVQRRAEAELDLPGILHRVAAYQYSGYFAPDELDDVVARLGPVPVEEPHQILANFVRGYAR